ncbi:MAG: DegV family protein [Clostridia bacterium]|nr:DegV family protein [Clostridia bacterium]
MERPWIISCESTVDMPYDYLQVRHIPVLFYSYVLDGEEYPDDMMRDPQALPAFYRRLEQGGVPATSQLNQIQYEEFWEPLLQKSDVLHVAFGTGMTGSYYNAVKAAEVLRAKYPDRRLIVIDSTCSCSGYGLLTEMAADLKDDGQTMEQVEQWLLENRWRMHHQFYTSDLTFFRRSGRVSGIAAMIGGVLKLCPLMRLNRAGKIVAYGRVRGRQAALRATLDEIERHARDHADYPGPCVVAHANCPQAAQQMQQAIRERFPYIGTVRIYDIGNIIASHCGPGTVAVFFMGDVRRE